MWILVSLFWVRQIFSGISNTFIDLNISRFVLYQLSKNLNRPFFMDFLTDLRWIFLSKIKWNMTFFDSSVKHATKPLRVDEEEPDSGEQNQTQCMIEQGVGYFLAFNKNSNIWYLTLISSIWKCTEVLILILKYFLSDSGLNISSLLSVYLLKSKETFSRTPTDKI